MITADWIFIAVLVAAAALGLLFGFGRSLKFFTGGIFGIVIAMIVCVMIGGTLQSVSFISDLMATADAWFASKWAFLEILHLGTVCYYLALFVVVQIIRIVVVRIVSQISKTSNPVARTIDKALGTAFMAAFVFGLMLLALASLKAFSSQTFASDLIAKLGDGFLHTLYERNPITFSR